MCKVQTQDRPALKVSYGLVSVSVKMYIKSLIVFSYFVVLVVQAHDHSANYMVIIMA